MSSLLELMNKIDWIQLENKNGGSKARHKGKVLVCSVIKNPLRENNYKFNFKFTKELREELGWELGDRICVMRDPNNVLNMKLVKANTGYTLALDGKTSTSRINFTCEQVIPLKEIKNLPVEYLPYQNQLIFRLPA